MFILIEFIFFLALRKQARHLENEIDAKLIALSKLGIKMTSHHANLETVPLMEEDNVFENMSSEIDSLLAKVKILKHRINFKPRFALRPRPRSFIAEHNSTSWYSQNMDKKSDLKKITCR